MSNANPNRFAVGVLVGLIVFAIYYPYRLFSSFVPFAFSGDASWRSHFVVENSVLAPFSARLIQFLMWMPTVIASQMMILCAIYLVVLILRGVYFERRTVRALQAVGLCAAVAGATYLGALAFDGWWLTQFNVDNRLPIRFHFDSGETGVLLSGLGLFLLGWVLDIAVFKATENKEFV